MATQLSTRIKKARTRAGITQGELARMLGITYPTLNRYERGHRTPDAALLNRMAKILECDPGWLLSGKGEDDERAPSAARPLTRTPVLRKVPDRFPERVSEEITEYISLPDVPRGAFSLIVRGESMSPAIRDSDYVIFVPRRDIADGDLIVVNDEWGESIVRRYRKRGSKAFLVSENPEYPAIKLSRRCRIMGKVIAVWRKVKI
ncbi:MAG: helix-turn-helix domain-containing protein [Deferribacteres bacterium]|nr:helix-turn-helix domain-containing protein [Deferribacteres bacterium]